MKKSAAVERWFADTKPPSEDAIRRLREIILGADPRMTELVKYGSLQFAQDGMFGAIVQPKKPGVNFMLARGGLLQGRYPHLEGEGRAVRFLRFKDKTDVNERAAEVKAIAREWSNLPARNGVKAPTSRRS